jgi:hypothetical protein
MILMILVEKEAASLLQEQKEIEAAMRASMQEEEQRKT